jgi:hypothetical protein
MQYSDLLVALDRDKMPVVVMVEGKVFWALYGVEPWSPMRDEDSPERARLLVQVLAYTHKEVVDSAGG